MLASAGFFFCVWRLIFAAGTRTISIVLSIPRGDATMATAPKLINAFTTPFFEAHLENASTLNDELRTLFIERERQGDKYRNPYMTPGKVGLFESDFDLFRWTEQPVQKLRSFCMDTIGHVIASLNGYDRGELARLEIINHTWFHITRKGGYTTYHNHPMASWSGVYCVDPGDAADDSSDSGILRFLDPRGMGNMFLDAGNSRLQQPFRVASLNFRLTPGRFIVFPSYLFHEVAPYQGDGTRITVAINSWVRERSPAADGKAR